MSETTRLLQEQRWRHYITSSGIPLLCCIFRQVVRVIWQKGHIATSHGWFSHIHQWAPHLIHSAWTHPSPHPKGHLDWFNCFCTAHGRMSLYFIWVAPFPPQNFPFIWRYLDPGLRHRPPSNMWFPGPNPNDISIIQQFLRGLQWWQTDHATPSVTIVLRCGLKSSLWCYRNCDWNLWMWFTPLPSTVLVSALLNIPQWFFKHLGSGWGAGLQTKR